MSETYNIYCDESCHLENDKQSAMVLGAVWCPLDKTHEIAVRVREIKRKHGLSSKFEVRNSRRILVLRPENADAARRRHRNSFYTW